MQHENGLRHIGNKERALRDIYKRGEKKKKEEEEERRELEKINRVSLSWCTGGRAGGERVASRSRCFSLASFSMRFNEKPNTNALIKSYAL